MFLLPIGPTGPTTQPPGPQDTDWVMVGVVTGVVLTLIFLLLVGLFLYIYLGKRRRSSMHKSKSSGVNVDLPPAGTGSDNSSFDDTKNSSSNHLVPQISTISNAYKSMTAPNGAGGASQPNGQSNVDGAPPGGGNGRSSSTSFANGITPTYWSASQLLKEHEERKIRENAAAVNSGPMGPIAEENAAYDYQSEAYPNYYYDYQQSHDFYQGSQMMYQPYSGQRMSTADSAYNYQSGAVDYHPNADNFDTTDPSEHLRNNNKMSALPKNSGNSDNSSSGTLGLANNSLQGSLISVNSGRPPSSVAKTRNITQV